VSDRKLSALALEKYPGVSLQQWRAKNWTDAQMEAAGWLEPANGAASSSVTATIQQIDDAKRKAGAAMLADVRANQYGTPGEKEAAKAARAAASTALKAVEQAAPKVPAVAMYEFDMDNQGNLIPNLNNIHRALRNPDAFGIQVRLDTFLDVVTIRDGDAWRAISDVDYVRMRMALELQKFKDVSHDKIRDSVMVMAEAHKFDSAIEWLNGLSWDGIPRVEGFLMNYFGVAYSPYAKAVSRYMWTALAGRTLCPGCQADMSIAFIGDQGLQKTKGLKAMVRHPDLYVEVDLSGKEDDNMRLLRGRQVAEISELKGLQTREAGQIKSFISRTTDKWVPKYIEHTHSNDRRCVFFGTGNEENFLSDPTGNRRWLPVTAGATNVEAIERDRDQLWAEGATIYRASGIAWQEAERLAKFEHANYFVDDPWHQPIVEWLSMPVGWLPGMQKPPPGPPRGDAPFTAADLMHQALGLRTGQINKSVEMRVAAILKMLRYVRGRHSINGVQCRAWCRVARYVPPQN
jgi:predicted P-loop ATPase